MAEFIRTEGVPVYVQIRKSLRAEITGGLLKRGEQLPSENELASKYNVSRMTIRESIGTSSMKACYTVGMVLERLSLTRTSSVITLG